MLIAVATPPPSTDLNWYDAFVGIVILYGLWRGIRTGLTGEFIRSASWILLIVVTLKYYQTIGKKISTFTKMDADLANLVTFIVLGIVIYTCALAIRWFVNRKRSKFKFGSILENMGGAVLGVARMVAFTVFVTVMICLIRSPFWHKQVGENSIYGRFVVSKLPAVAKVVQTKFPETLWIVKEIKRPEDRTVD